MARRTQLPLVWESDLKEWIAGWQSDGSVIVNGLGPRERVPKLDHHHTLTFVPVAKRTVAKAKPAKKRS